MFNSFPLARWGPMQPATIEPTLDLCTRYRLWLGRPRLCGIWSLPDTCTHGQHWESKPRTSDLESNALSIWPHAWPLPFWGAQPLSWTTGPRTGSTFGEGRYNCIGYTQGASTVLTVVGVLKYLSMNGTSFKTLIYIITQACVYQLLGCELHYTRSRFRSTSYWVPYLWFSNSVTSWQRWLIEPSHKSAVI